MSDSIKSDTIRALKHLRRYGSFEIPDCMEQILIFSLKGQSCEFDHLDPFQRDSLYNYLKDKEIDDIYIKQFIKECEFETGEESKPVG
jgi:hypothetical protein